MDFSEQCRIEGEAPDVRFDESLAGVA